MRPVVVLVSTVLLGATAWGAPAEASALPLPLTDVPTPQQVHRPYTSADGLPSDDVARIGRDATGAIVAITTHGPAVWQGARWESAEEDTLPPRLGLAPEQHAALEALAGAPVAVRSVAQQPGEIAVAADAGLFLFDGARWSLALPRDGEQRWAPADVRAVCFDAAGRLWFAAPQGVGMREAPDAWRLYTGAEGLPYNDFTCIAAGPAGEVWFGTTNGAIRYREGAFSFRQGGRWLLDNHVRDIAVDDAGAAWIATAAGVSCLAEVPMTLAEKADYFEDETDRYNRRTAFGFVNPARLARPGDKSTATPVFSDNDGHNMGVYLGAMSLAYGATGEEKYRRYAQQAFRALVMLGDVTAGGTHPAPEGFVARAIVPTSGPDPNLDFDLAYDQRRNRADALWKIMQPRWPIDETGQWYWKCDSSSDELDGHFFGYALYYDHVCESEAERDEVRAVVRRIADHLIRFGYNLVDHDGQPTRWGRFSPADLNRNEAWVVERGLNSYSILTYLSIAHRLTGDPRYREHYLTLALEHGYGMNGMTQPRDIAGPGTFGQPDDNMAFMNYYHLIRYEDDPQLLSMYYHAIHRHWLIEQYERNPFTNYVYAACCMGKVRVDHWGPTDISPPESCFEDARDTLQRYPLDLIDWPMSNAHRSDLVRLGNHLGQNKDAGHRVDGHVFPVDERYEINWGWDPWVLRHEGSGLRLREAFHYQIAYFLGLAHGFLAK